jgi:hypothetical protein
MADKSKIEPRAVRHPKDPFIDRAQITTVERYKTSGVSGDEWRFSYRVDLYRKEKLVAWSCFGSMEFAAVKLLEALHLGFAELEMEERWETIDWKKVPDLEKVCCHPGCAQPPTRVYVLKRTYSRNCSLSEEAKSLRYPKGRRTRPARYFCDRHGQRGDCGLDDGNANYICIEGKDWTEAPVDPDKVREAVLVL